MNATAPLKSFIVLLLVCGLAAAPLAATRHERSQSATTAAQQNDDDADGVTFDNLLRASSYTLYIEVRNVGAVLRSPEFRETFEPISPMLGHFVGGTETTLVRLVTDNADRLQRSRVMLAFSPADSSLPALIVGVEMESEDAAKEFEAMAKERFASLAAVAQEVAGRSAGADPANGANPTPTAIRRADRLIVISFTPFTFKALRGANDESMSDDMNFRAARDRFYAEPLFVYYDVALSGRKRKALEETLRNSDEEITNTPSRVIVTADSSEEITVVQPRSATTSGRAAAAQRPAPSQASPRKSGAAAPPPAIRAAPVAPTVASPAARKETDPLGDLLGLMLSGESQEPEAVAIALALEHDALIARALMIGPPGATAGPLPFLSPPISGPAISSEAAGYLPADTGIFVAASLDWARLYDLATHPSRKPRGMSRGSAAQLADFDARRAAFEKASGVRLADLLASALGNEVALSVPASYLGGTPLGRMPMNARAAASMPLMLVAVRDREALAPRLPALLEALGIKPANAKAATEKVGDVEVTSYGNIAYAFVNHYLMMAANVASLRQALEARAGHTTLADDRNFQSYTEWQPRASVTQIYVSAGVLKGLIPNRPRTDDRMDQETKEFLARYHFDPEPITFAASAEGVGAHYELRLPKRLLMRVFSEIAATEVASRMPRNEAITRGFLQSFQEYEKSYKTRHGKYATLDEMIANDKSSESSAQKYAGVGFYKQMIEQSGYRLEVTATAGGYEVTATPTEYGKTGRLSFYTDQTGVVREGDHQGKPASSSDKPAGKN